LSADYTLLTIEYVPVDEAVLWDRNPKRHDIGALVESIWTYGFQDPSKYDAALEAIVYGNGRIQAVQAGQREGRQPPRGVALLPDGRWAVPVVFGNDLDSRAAAEAFAVDHNNLTLAGGDFTAHDIARLWDGQAYLALLAEFAVAGQMPVTVDGDDLDALLAQVQEAEAPEEFGAYDEDLATEYCCPKCGYEWSGKPK
jgi:hypothetical protein